MSHLSSGFSIFNSERQKRTGRSPGRIRHGGRSAGEERAPSTDRQTDRTTDAEVGEIHLTIRRSGAVSSVRHECKGFFYCTVARAVRVLRPPPSSSCCSPDHPDAAPQAGEAADDLLYGANHLVCFLNPNPASVLTLTLCRWQVGGVQVCRCAGVHLCSHDWSSVAASSAGVHLCIASAHE